MRTILTIVVMFCKEILKIYDLNSADTLVPMVEFLEYTV